MKYQERKIKNVNIEGRTGEGAGSALLIVSTSEVYKGSSKGRVYSPPTSSPPPSLLLSIGTELAEVGSCELVI